MDSDLESLQFGAIAIKVGYLDRQQVLEAVEIQRQMKEKGQALMIGQILLKRGVITTEEFLHILSIQRGDKLSNTPWPTVHLEHKLDTPKPAPAVTPRPEPIPPGPAPEVVEEPTQHAEELEALIQEEGPSDAFTASETSAYIGKYRILGAIGSGGMGQVYRVFDADLDRVFACKAIRTQGLDPTLVERFRQEARVLARLNHPNIVRVHYYNSERSTHFLIMDLIEGFSVEDHLERGNMPLQAGINILWVIARALHYAHSHGVLHRDLKPKNIMLVEQKLPVLIDFGLSHVSASDIQATVNEPPKGLRVGTPAYMAPEQIAGKIEEIEKCTDVYALGVVLYRLITGRLPFTGKTAGEIYRKTLTEAPVPPRQINPAAPSALELVCLKTMAKKKASRFATAGEFADALRPFLKAGN